MTSPAPHANTSIPPKLSTETSNESTDNTEADSTLNSPVESEDYDQTPSEPLTRQNSNGDGLVPGLGGTPAYLQFTPRRAMASFDNLVALANHQERLREARKMLWRDRGEPVIELEDLKACVIHACKGGFRAATLAFNIRAAFSLVLALIRINKVPRDKRLSTIRKEVLGLDSVRFGAMIGTFVAVYKLLINALPFAPGYINKYRTKKYASTFAEDDDTEETQESSASLAASTTLQVPVPSKDGKPQAGSSNNNMPYRRSARLSLSRQATLAIVRKKTKRWHAAVAGFAAGAAGIMWEADKERRITIGQQMFVRGLQGVWNAGSEKRGWDVPYGSVLVFGLACGQIMYSWLMRPDALPRSYTNWISQASKVPRECVRMQNDLCRYQTFNLSDLDTILARKDLTPANLTALQAFRFQALTALTSSTSPIDTSLPSKLLQPAGLLQPFTPCATIHPALTSCMSVPLDRFFAVGSWMLPIYGALHFIPPVLFKWKVFKRDPGSVLVKAGLGSLRSSAFLGVFVVIYQSLLCYKHYLYALLTSPSSPIKLPLWLTGTLVSRYSAWVLGFLSGLSLLVEENRRRGELAMYVLPKALECSWIMARGKGLVGKTGRAGDVLLTAVGMSMVMSTYQNDPQHLSGLVRRVLYQFVGPN